MTTNLEFCKQDEVFREACSVAGIPTTTRQASKWRMDRGLARRFFFQAKQNVMRRRNQDNIDKFEAA